MLAGFEMNAVDGAGLHAVLAVQIRATESRSEGFIVTGKLSAAGNAIRDLSLQVRQMRQAANLRRADEKKLWRLIVWAGGAGEDHSGEDARTVGDLTWWQVVETFEIIGSEHEHDDVDRLMTFETGRQVVFTIAAHIEWVFMHGGASILAFFDDAEIRAKIFG